LKGVVELERGKRVVARYSYLKYPLQVLISNFGKKIGEMPGTTLAGQ
jgi:hypothetical protein